MKEKQNTSPLPKKEVGKERDDKSNADESASEWICYRWIGYCQYITFKILFYLNRHETLTFSN